MIPIPINLNVINREQILPNGKVITLNEQQWDSINKMIEWLLSDQYDELDETKGCSFVVQGYAGTGKSTIIKTILNALNVPIVVSAPTHKAKKVIGRATKRNAQTLQSLLGLGLDIYIENFDPNDPKFKFKKDPKVKLYRVVVIDEAGMINSDLYDVIIDLCIKHNVRVIFMGDRAQLPPIDEEISKVFQQTYNSVLLSKVERQKGDNPLMSIYDNIRNNMGSKKDCFEHKTQIIKDDFNKIQGIIFIDRNDNIKQKDMISKLFKDMFKKDQLDYVRLLSFTNKSVQLWNNRIRKMIFNNIEGPLPIILKNDILMSYNTVTFMDSTIIENSADYRVLDVDEGEVSYTFSRGGLQLDNNTFKINVFRVLISDTDGDDKNANWINIVIPNNENYREFINLYNLELAYAKNTKGDKAELWTNFYNFKSKFLLLEDLKNGYSNIKKDLSYGYAITIHKSQGSTYEVVIVDEHDISICRDIKLKNSLKYVAFSRPKRLCISFTNAIDTFVSKTKKVPPSKEEETQDIEEANIVDSKVPVPLVKRTVNEAPYETLIQSINNYLSIDKHRLSPIEKDFMTDLDLLMTRYQTGLSQKIKKVHKKGMILQTSIEDSSNKKKA